MKREERLTANMNFEVYTALEHVNVEILLGRRTISWIHHNGPWCVQLIKTKCEEYLIIKAL